ncbi:MAG TPA: chemotaxis protein CheW [Gammaproteobacteria bacterium]|nr:chemotaxis protein CheW [Gammaproteobacteria bacterium]
MLYSHFLVDDGHFVIPAECITEIIPCVSIKKQSSLPGYVAGLMNYHGDTISVIDLSMLLIGKASKKKLSTRIIIINGADVNGKKLMFGLMAEKATDMVNIDESSFKPPMLSDKEALIEGDVAIFDDDLMTRISISEIIKKINKKLFVGKIES